MWCHCFIKNSLFPFFPLSLNKPPLKNMPHKYTTVMELGKTGHVELGCKFCSRWAFHQVSSQANSATLVTVQLWWAQGCFPSAFASTSIGKPTKTRTGDVWEGVEWKPRTSCSTGTPRVEALLSRLLRKSPLLGPVCERCLPPPPWEGDPGRRHLAETMSKCHPHPRSSLLWAL